MFPGKSECILAQSDLVWSQLCSSCCFTPQTGQPEGLKIALRELTIVALEVQVFLHFKPLGNLLGQLKQSFP